MQHLYAPWRQKYFEEDKSLCPFCAVSKRLESDEKLGVFLRARHCFGVMNAYPYAPGHFMIIPYIHEENIEKLELEIWQEMSLLVREGVAILKEKFKAGGVNIGMNLGAVAGAGISAHCHYHLVPRWSGDTNFITSIAELRVCGRDLQGLYKELSLAFKPFHLG